MCRGRSLCTFEHPGPVKSVKICGARTERDRPYGFVAMVDPHHAALVLEGRQHPFPVKRNNRLPAAGSSQPSQTNEAAPEPPPSSANNNNNNSSHSSANHLHTTNEPTGNAADKLEDRIVWVGDLHKLSTVGGNAVLVPLISSYLRRFGPLDQANPRLGPLKVRQSTGGQATLGYAFVAFEHSRFAEAALRNSVMPDAKLKLAPHKESKYMHDVSWKQGEAEAAAVATTTPAAAVAPAVTIRQPPVHISPPAPPEASPPPAQFNTDAPPFASNRASSTTVFATSQSTPTERPEPARPSAHTARVSSSGTCSAHSTLFAPTAHARAHMHVHMHMHMHTHTHCMPPRAAGTIYNDGADPGGQGPHQAAQHRRADWAGESHQVRRIPLVRAASR